MLWHLLTALHAWLPHLELLILVSLHILVQYYFEARVNWVVGSVTLAFISDHWTAIKNVGIVQRECVNAGH